MINQQGDRVPFLTRNGVKIIDIKKGYCKVKLEYNDQILNESDQIDEGVIYSLAESISGIVFETYFDGKRYFPLVYRQSIEFLKIPPKVDLFVEQTFSQRQAEQIEEELNKKGKSKYKTTANVVDKEGNIYAKSYGYYMGKSLNYKL
ncbi:hypothetical protein PPERSA_11337 [Pseudocohnilembus persalinus]|uniref:Uncharacterized protein n=1 Tax=Pseudocohnilembus persalinus TaxID=266149 RepID=A0A0V0QQI1_PSEPJ|nr:hypothetical protein PPERSA_11337 [Pseudocohnilembus persalinus]|eukprot:KRX04213.1 hypothetical protein PPERSA_11337 [Pseudocohnilembus persalinus]